MYEISYNGHIADNTFVRNALGAGPTNPGFPTGAIYISESGSDSRVSGPYSNSFDITDNVFDDNWSGVVLWENSNRFCGPDSPDNAGSLCTLVDPSAASPTTCVRPGHQLPTAVQRLPLDDPERGCHRQHLRLHAF